jgi:hypothetical protein
MRDLATVYLALKRGFRRLNGRLSGPSWSGEVPGMSRFTSVDYAYGSGMDQLQGGGMMFDFNVPLMQEKE